MQDRNEPPKPDTVEGDFSQPSTESVVVHELVVLASAGDQQAQGELFRKYLPVIKSVVMARGEEGLLRTFGSRAEAEDVIQTVAMRILEALPEYQWQSRNAFLGWLKTITKAKLVDEYRLHTAEKRDHRADAELDGEHRSADTEPDVKAAKWRLRWQLEDALKAIPAPQAAAVQLRTMDYTYAEIADVLETTEEAARKLCTRGKSRLEEHLVQSGVVVGEDLLPVV